MNHEKFQKHLQESMRGVEIVATWLKAKGYEIQVPETKVAPTHEQWREYADHGDLFIKQRIEVKQLGINFSHAGDWLYAPRYIVCAKHSFDRADHKPHAYVHLSKDGKHAGIVYTSSRSRWYVDTVKDSRYQDYAQECYLAKLSDVKFISLEEKK